MTPTLPPGVQMPGETEPEDGPLIHLARNLEQFPSYIFYFFFGLLLASLIDPIVTALVIAGVASGVAFGWSVGVAAFFFAYTVVRVVNSIAGAFVRPGSYGSPRG